MVFTQSLFLPFLAGKAVELGVDHVGHLLQVFDTEGLVAPAAVAHDVLQRVAHGALGHEVLVLELRFHQVHGLVELLLVRSQSSELEVNELHHSLQVLDGTAAAHAIGVVTDGQISAGLLAGKCLLQFRVGEVAQTGVGIQAGDEFQVGSVILAVQRLATALEGGHRDFVLLEVGFLEHDTCTVAQFKHLVAEIVVHALLDDFALLGHLGHQGLVLHVVHIGGDFGVVGGVKSGLEALNGGIYGTFLLLVEVGDNHILAFGVDVLGNQFVDGLNGDIGSNHAHILEILLNRGDGLAI